MKNVLVFGLGAVTAVAIIYFVPRFMGKTLIINGGPHKPAEVPSPEKKVAREGFESTME